jgi:hypothetical protein
MNKQINPVINGKGGVGQSSFASNFVQYLKDCGIAHCVIDSDHENAILKPFIAVATPDVAKTLSFLLPALRAAAPPSKNSKTLLPIPEMQSSRVAFPSPQLPQAPLRSSFRQHAITAVRCELSSHEQLCMNRSWILWLAARRKGIARAAVLHLDCARSAKKTARIDSSRTQTSSRDKLRPFTIVDL